jgi:hypothetical protein
VDQIPWLFWREGCVAQVDEVHSESILLIAALRRISIPE